MIHNRLVALIYRGGCLAIAVLGILSISGVFTGDAQPGTLMYYTLQSNILVALMFAFLTVRTAIGLKKDGINGSVDYAPGLEMVCSVDIFLTFLVYWVMLVPQSLSMSMGYQFFGFGNLTVHGITPILCILDYIFLTDSHKLKKRHIGLTLVFPLAYFVVMSIVGACGYVFQTASDGTPVHYPYFFMDYDRTGGMAAVYILVLVGIFVLLSVGLYALDKKWNKKVLLPKNKNSIE